MEIRFDVYFKKQIGTLFKEGEVDLNGKYAHTNLQLALVDNLEIRYKVNGVEYSDIVTITDISENLIQIPFKSDVIKKGTNEFELIAYMKNGDIKKSQTYIYEIEESIEEGIHSDGGASSDGHTHFNLNILNSITQAKINEWDNKANAYHSHTNYANINHTHSEYATQTYVRNEIANAQLGGENSSVDLSGYATKDDLSLKADIAHTHNANEIEGLGNVSADLSDYATISYVDERINTLNAELSSVKQSVSNGKDLIASAITDKGISTSNDNNFVQIAENIYSINTVNSFLSNINMWEVLGDSITEGYGPVDSTETYHQVLGRRYNIDRVLNRGISATTVSSYNQPFYNRVANMSSEADLITVWGGVNDFRRNVNLGEEDSTDGATFNGALNLLIEALLEKFPNKKIIFFTPMPVREGRFNTVQNGLNDRGLSIYDYANAIISRCEANNISVINLTNKPILNPNNDTVNERYFYDGLHPNEIGSTLIANILNDCIIEEYTPPTDTTIYLTSLALNNSNLNLNEGDTSMLIVTYNPNNTTQRNLIWSSSNESIATVENGLVTAISEGNCTIRVTSLENPSISVSCNLNVIAKEIEEPEDPEDPEDPEEPEEPTEPVEGEYVTEGLMLYLDSKNTNNTDTVLEDLSGNSYNFTSSKPLSLNADNFLVLDGSTSLSNSTFKPFISSTDNFTFEFYGDIESTGGRNYFYSYASRGGFSWDETNGVSGQNATSGDFIFPGSDSIGYNNGRLAPTFGRKHIIITKNGNTFSLYVDGVLLSSVDNTVEWTNNTYTNFKLFVRYNSTNYLRGALRYVRIYNKSFTLTEVLINYNTRDI